MGNSRSVWFPVVAIFLNIPAIFFFKKYLKIKQNRAHIIKVKTSLFGADVDVRHLLLLSAVFIILIRTKWRPYIERKGKKTIDDRDVDPSADWMGVV